MVMNDKGSIMTCGLYIGVGEVLERSFSGTEIPHLSTGINIHVVDLLAEVCLTYKCINSGDLPINPTFVFPLNNIGLLYDVEVTVNDEKRLSMDKDSDDLKRIQEQGEIHLIKFGEVPPKTEVTIKCTYVSISNVTGDVIEFILPSYLIPSRSECTEGGTNQRVSLSVNVHDKFISVISPSHPESVGSPLVLSGGTKADIEVNIPAPGLTKDLVFLVHTNNPRAPRVWTSAGTSGTVPSRMSMSVVCPPVRDVEISEEGEVIIFLDVREGDQEQILRASLEKVPKWTTFNVWANLNSSDGFAPIFEDAVSANEQNVAQAIEKMKSYVPFSGDDESLVAFVRTMLSGLNLHTIRTFFFVTSMGLIDEALKLITIASRGGTVSRDKDANSHTPTTPSTPTTPISTRLTSLDNIFLPKKAIRSVVVSLKSTCKERGLPFLLSLNGGLVVNSTTQELQSLLPTLLEKYIQPVQHISTTPSIRPAHQTPHAMLPLFQGQVVLNFMAHFDQLNNPPSVEIKGRDTETGAEKSIAIARPKETTSQVLHRIVCYALLNERKAGLKGTGITSAQYDILQTILYSSWEYKLLTQKGESGGRLPIPEKSQSVSSVIASIRGGMLKTPALTKFKTMPGNKKSDIREHRLNQYSSINQKHAVSEVDHIERVKINFSELEPHALEFGLEYIKESLSPKRTLTAADCVSLRKIVMPIIEDTDSICPDGPEVGVYIKKLKPLIQNALKEKWGPTEDPVTPWYEVVVCSDKGSRPHMEDQNVMWDCANSLLGLPAQPRISFFGVFDGHSGRHAGEFAKVNLPFNVIRGANFDAQKLLNQETDSITEGYLKTDADFLAIAEKDNYKSGTTAVTVVLLDSRHMIVSNVGDSEAVMCRDGAPVQLSILHKPLNEKEKQRVTEAGGTIVHYGTYRVNGVLAVTRSIGDHALKAHVPANPDTVVEKITDKDEFVILASDGLWEKVTYQEAVDLVRNERARMRDVGPDAEKTVAQLLVDEAMRKESKDNVTVLVIFFKH